MWKWALTPTLILVMVGVVGLATREVILFRRLRNEYPLRRLTLRLSTAVMLIVQMASILVGVRVFHLNEPEGVVWLWLVFWGCIGLLTVSVICLVVADFRTIGDETTNDVSSLWRDIAHTIAEHEQQRTQDEQQTEAHDPDDTTTSTP